MSGPRDPRLVADLGAQAEALSRIPLWSETLDAMRQDCINTWEGSTAPGQREEQWHRLHAIGELRRSLERMIEDAKLTAERQSRNKRATG